MGEVANYTLFWFCQEKRKQNRFSFEEIGNERRELIALHGKVVTELWIELAETDCFSKC